MRKLYWVLLGLFLFNQASAQQDSTNSGGFNFEDVDATPIKRYASQKVLNQSPNRFISIGYEYQGGFDYQEPLIGIGFLPANLDARLRRASGLRISSNNPIISRNKFIWSLGVNYWNTTIPVAEANPFKSELLNSMSGGLHSAGINSTIFKPFNEKNFLIVQASADANFSANSLDQVTSQALTFSASAVYGWKKSDNLMWGLGIARTYRLGRIIYVPVWMYNKTFNDKWGVEVLLPARAHVRRNINSKSLMLAGFELEGNQYALYQPGRTTTFLQRGEIKPRISYERSLSGFWWISIQAGYRVNGRFVVVDKYDGSDKREIVAPTIGNPFYFNISLNLVSL